MLVHLSCRFFVVFVNCRLIFKADKTLAKSTNFSQNYILVLFWKSSSELCFHLNLYFLLAKIFEVFTFHLSHL